MVDGPSSQNQPSAEQPADDTKFEALSSPAAVSRPLTFEIPEPRLLIKNPPPELPESEIPNIAARFETIIQRAYLDQRTAPDDYHIWQHAKEVLAAVEGLVEKAIASGVKVDRLVCRVAALGHDAMFHLNHEALGFASKEEASATYVYNVLRAMGAPDNFARRVYRAIMATHPLADPKEPEEMILRAADLRSVSGDYNVFRENTGRLYSEHRFNNPQSVPFSAFVTGSINFLANFAIRFLEVTKESRDNQGRSVWHQNALRNMISLYSEIHPDVRVIVQSAAAGARAIPIIEHNEGDFIILIDQDPINLENALVAMRAALGEKSKAIPILAVPGEFSSVPLGDRSVDLLFIPQGSSATAQDPEIERVIKKTGRATSEEAPAQIF